MARIKYYLACIQPNIVKKRGIVINNRDLSLPSLPACTETHKNGDNEPITPIFRARILESILARPLPDVHRTMNRPRIEIIEAELTL